VKALGITSAQRSPFLPEIPSIAESGLPGYEAYGSAGMLGPPNMPREILQRLNKETVAVLEQKEVLDLMIPQGMLPAPCSPEEFTAFLKAELGKWGEVVKAANIKGE
jgi:tripartite-type tricarboxylate transporter receptor subunit TctC